MCDLVGRFAIHPSVPAQTVAEFVAYAKANPGKVNFGSSGLGTITQLFGEMLNLEAGIKMIHVPYKGSAQATHDLLAGRSRRSSTRPCCRISRRAGCAGWRCWPTSRWPHKPDIPTLRETGLRQGGRR